MSEQEPITAADMARLRWAKAKPGEKEKHMRRISRLGVAARRRKARAKGTK